MCVCRYVLGFVKSETNKYRKLPWIAFVFLCIPSITEDCIREYVSLPSFARVRPGAQVVRTSKLSHFISLSYPWVKWHFQGQQNQLLRLSEMEGKSGEKQSWKTYIKTKELGLPTFSFCKERFIPICFLVFFFFKQPLLWHWSFQCLLKWSWKWQPSCSHSDVRRVGCTLIWGRRGDQMESTLDIR